MRDDGVRLKAGVAPSALLGADASGPARRRMALRTLAFGGSLLLVALLAVRSLVDAVEHRFFNAFSVLRIQEAARHLDAALHEPAGLPPHKTVYVFGSSLMEFGFSPDIFDETLAATGHAVRSYNFAYGNADPGIHHLFATRFARLFARHPGKVDLVVFEFTPFQATRRREQQTGQLDGAVQAMLYEPADFLALAAHDHEKAVTLLTTRIFRGGVPAEAITNLLTTLTRAAITPSAPVDDGVATPLRIQAMSLYKGLLAEWPQADPPGGWYGVNRGGLPPTASEESLQLTDAVMARLQVPARMQASRLQRLACCDIENLDISNRLLDDFIAAVKEARSVSGRVDVLLMPRNQDVIHLTPGGRAHLQRALSRLRRETGARIVDFSERPSYDVHEFLDADHLTLFQGRARLTRQLAAFYADDPLLASTSTSVSGRRPAGPGR